MVVNNTNLDTGSRLQDPVPKELMRSIQRLAEERGLSFFSEGREAGSPSRFPARRGRPGESVHFRRAEKELLEKGGYSWVADIRNRVLIARRAARDEADFLGILDEIGIEVSDAAVRNGVTDWVYGLPGEGARRIRGENLGTSFGQRAVRQELALRAVPRKADVMGEIARNAVEVGSLQDLNALAEALDAFSREGIRSIADCEARIAAMEAGGDYVSMERLAEYRDYAVEKGILPQHSAGKRRRVAPDDGHATAKRGPRGGAARQHPPTQGDRNRDERGR